MTQCERILKYMKGFGSISSMQAFLDLGITRLSGRIYDLRKAGYKIERIMQSSVNRYGDVTTYAVYRLEDEE